MPELKGLWKRKRVIHAAEDIELAKAIARRTPSQLRHNPADPPDPQLQVLIDAYPRLYGQEEADRLQQDNMVEAYEQAWVKAVDSQVPWYEPADPVEERQPGPDEEWVYTPWGRFIRKKQAASGGSGVTIAQVAQIAEERCIAVLKSLGIIR